MKARIVCLANSYKEGGRCVAGIELNQDNELLCDKKWIRPVCRTQHGEIPIHLVFSIKPLDIIEFEITEDASIGFQTENVLFNTKSIRKAGVFDHSKLESLCCNNPHPQTLFGNKGKAVSADGVHLLKSSLIFISTLNFEIIERQYEDKSHPQIRLKFDYHSASYDLPITDPIFLDKYKQNNQLLKGIEKLYLVVSLGILHEGWHYKLVASVLY